MIFTKRFPPLDHVVIHHRDLRNRSTNIDEAEKKKVQKHFAP